MGSIPIGSVNLDGPLSLGYLVKILPWRDERVRTPHHRATNGFPTRPLSVLLAVRKHFSTGRRIGLLPLKRVVAGSSPAFGTRRRSSSVVEHVIPSSFFIRRFFAGRRLWVIETVGWRFNSTLAFRRE